MYHAASDFEPRQGKSEGVKERLSAVVHHASSDSEPLQGKSEGVEEPLSADSASSALSVIHR